jgi:hypothetical protein
MSLIEYDNMIEALTADCTYQAFDMIIVPGAF